MRRGDPAGDGGRVAAVGALLAVVVVAASLAGPWNPPLTQDRWRWAPFGEHTLRELPPRKPAPDPLENARRLLGTGGRHVDVVPWLEGVLLALALLGAVLLLVRAARRAVLAFVRGRRRRAGAAAGALAARTDAVEPDLATLTRGVADAGGALHRDVAPADAVIAAWADVETAAGDCGVYREPSQTATELTVAVLDRTWADPAATRSLLALYLRARYGHDPLGPNDVAGARTALARLERDLGEQHARWLAGQPSSRGDRP